MIRVFSGLLFSLFGRSILIPVHRHTVTLVPEYTGLEIPFPKIPPVGTHEYRMGIRDFLD